MPSAGKHLRNAERHRAAAIVAGDNEVTRSWAAVALFYASHQLVHAVLDGEASLSQELKHPTSHGTPPGGALGTSALVARRYVEIDVAYKSLFGVGKAVRYNGLVVAPADWLHHRSNDFAKIARWAGKALRDQGRTQLPDWL